MDRTSNNTTTTRNNSKKSTGKINTKPTSTTEKPAASSSTTIPANADWRLLQRFVGDGGKSHAEEKDFTAQNASRCAAAVQHITTSTPVQARASALVHQAVATWLMTAPGLWINALTTRNQFDSTMHFIKTDAFPKPLVGLLLQACIARLTSGPSKTWPELVQWLRDRRAEYFSPQDIKPHFAALTSALVRVVCASPSLECAMDASHLLWGMSTIALALSATGPMAQQLAASGLVPSSPGPFVLQYVCLPLLGHQDACGESQQVVFSMEGGGGGDDNASREQWLQVVEFALTSCASPQHAKRAAACNVLQRIVEPLSCAISRYCAHLLPASAPSPTLHAVLQALQLCKDVSVQVQLLQAVDANRHLLGADNAALYHELASALAEIGVALVAEQVARWGTVLLTHNYATLWESDAMEDMVLSDLNFLLTSKLAQCFKDGRLVLRICQACVWPDYLPLVTARALDLARLHGMDQLAEIKALLLTRTSTANKLLPLRGPITAHQLLQQHARGWTPAFALDGCEFRILRAKRFSDLSLDNVDAGQALLWEAYLEEAEMEEERAGIAFTDLTQWTWFWTCRALTLCSLKSKFGSAKDTFQHFESALLVPAEVGSTMQLLWTLHRELLVFAPHHADAKIASFFAVKNADVCQSWLLRLVTLGMQSNGRDARLAHLFFYYLYYDKPAMWTARVVEELALSQRPACLAALATQREYNKPWLRALELYARGALCLAKDALRAVLEEEAEEEAAEQVAVAKRVLAKCESRLGQWESAPQPQQQQPLLQQQEPNALLVSKPDTAPTSALASPPPLTTTLSFAQHVLRPQLHEREKGEEDVLEVCIAALTQGDFAFAALVFPRLVESNPPSLPAKLKLATTLLAMGDRGVTPPHEVEGYLSKLFGGPDAKERKLFAPGNAALCLDELDSNLAEWGDDDGPARAIAARTFGDLCAQRGDFSNAARFHAQSPDAFLLLLTDLDEFLVDETLEDFPMPELSVLKPHIDQLLSRVTSSSTSTGVKRYAFECLKRLVDERAREMAWALLVVAAEEEQGQGQALVAELVRRIHPQEIWQETQHFARALIQASRTMDEELGQVMQDLEEHLLASAQVQSIGHTLHDEYFAHALGWSEFETKFRASQAGQAVAEWCLDASNARKFTRAKTLLLQGWLQQQTGKRSAMELSPDLGKYSFSFAQLGGGDGEVSVRDTVYVLKTKTRPRRLVFDQVHAGAALPPRAYLLKSGEDLRLDARLNRLWELILGPSAACYAVVPLSRKVGLIEWVSGAVPIHQAYREWKQEKAAGGEEDALLTAPPPQFSSKLDSFRALKQVNAGAEDSLKRLLWKQSNGPENWLARVERFTESCGAWSALGWLTGLGDRHLDNILVNSASGQVVHVDLNVCFDRGRTLRVPETVPFRLTGIITGALLMGDNVAQLKRGPFGASMQDTMSRIASARNEILSFLKVFVLDSANDSKKSARSRFDLKALEFEASKLAFIAEAEQWLAEAHPLAALRIVEEEESRESPRLLLERARALVHRTQMEYERQRERAALALDRILACNERTFAQFELLGIACLPALERCVAQVRRFPALSKLHLACLIWSTRLGDVLKRVTSSNTVPVLEDCEAEGSGGSRPLDALAMEDLAALARERGVQQQQQEQEQTVPGGSSKRARQDFIALCDAIFMLAKPQDATSARTAWSALQRACSRVNLPLARALLQRAPRSDKFSSSDAAIAEYDRALLAATTTMEVDMCSFIAKLERAVDALRALEYHQQQRVPVGNRVQTLAIEANARVRSRVDQAALLRADLVDVLIDEATSEENLSEMYVGWMAFV